MNKINKVIYTLQTAWAIYILHSEVNSDMSTNEYIFLASGTLAMLLLTKVWFTKE